MSEKFRPSLFTIEIPLTDDILAGSFGDFRRMCLAQVRRDCATFCGVEESALAVTRAEVRLKTVPLGEVAEVDIWLAWAW